LRIIYRLIKDTYLAEAVNLRPLSPHELLSRANKLWSKYLGYAPSTVDAEKLLRFHDLILRVVSKDFGEPVAVDHIITVKLPAGGIKMQADLVMYRKGRLEVLLMDPLEDYEHSPINSFAGHFIHERMRREFPDYKVSTHFLTPEGEKLSILSAYPKEFIDYVNNIVTGIQAELWYPRANRLACRRCYYHPICKYGEGIER